VQSSTVRTRRNYRPRTIPRAEWAYIVATGQSSGIATAQHALTGGVTTTTVRQELQAPGRAPARGSADDDICPTFVLPPTLFWVRVAAIFDEQSTRDRVPAYRVSQLGSYCVSKAHAHAPPHTMCNGSENTGARR